MPESKAQGKCSRCGYVKQVRLSLSCFTRWGREIKGHFCDFCWNELWLESTKHIEVAPEPIPDKEQMEMLQGNVKVCRKALKVGDMRNVKVRTVLDYETKTVTRMRLDTMDILEQRPMNEKELQVSLQGV